MVKTILGLSLLGISSTFSFYKMSDGYFFKQDPVNNEKYDDISQDKILSHELSPDNLNESSYFVYCYDVKLKYYLFDLHHHNSGLKTLMCLFKQQKFDLQQWENFFNSKHLLDTIPPIFRAFYPHFPILGIVSTSQIMNDINKYTGGKYLSIIHKEGDVEKNKCIANLILPFDAITSKSKAFLYNNKFHIILSQENKESTKLNFQSVLLKYMKSQKHRQDQLFESVLKLSNDLQDQTQNNRSITDSILQIINATKTTYTQEQIDLLENSKILAVWEFIPKMYYNKEYQEQLYPGTNPQWESKIINPMIMSFAYDTRDQMTYNWIIDLGQDISVLLNYADETNTLETIQE